MCLIQSLQKEQCITKCVESEGEIMIKCALCKQKCNVMKWKMKFKMFFA